MFSNLKKHLGNELALFGFLVVVGGDIFTSAGKARALFGYRFTLDYKMDLVGCHATSCVLSLNVILPPLAINKNLFYLLLPPP
jgi:hypothetical protein